MLGLVFGSLAIFVALACDLFLLPAFILILKPKFLSKEQKEAANAELDTHFIETHHGLLFRTADDDRVQDLPLASLYLLLRMEQVQHYQQVLRQHLIFQELMMILIP